MNGPPSAPPPDAAGPGPEAAAPAPAMAPRRHRAWRWWAGGAAALLTLALLVIAGGAWWVLRNERGSAWLLARLPGVEVVNPRGRLIGDFGADAVTWRFGEGGELRLADVAWQGLGIYRSEVPGAWALVWFDRLAAREARLTLPERPQRNARPPPRHLKLPVELVVRQFALDQLQSAALGDAPLQGLRARIHLGGRPAGGGATTPAAPGGRASPATGLPADLVRHRIDGLALTRGPLRLAGHVQVGAEAPMPADVALTLAQPADASPAPPAAAPAASAPAATTLPPWDARLRLAGPLARSQLQGRLRVQAEPVQTLDIDAVLQPFAAWPLARLNARVQALDLGALMAGAPRTALSGEVVLAMADAETPLQAQARLQNGRPGAWSSGLLPARRLQLTLQADPRDRRQARLESLDAELGDAAQPAGRVQGQGQWRADGAWQLGLALHGLRPDRLDTRVMPMQLDGRVTLDGSATPPGAPGPARRQVSMTSDVSGRLLDRAPGAPVLLQAAGELASGAGGALAIDLKRLLVRQGNARAEAKGRLQRASASADWQARGGLKLAGFDPRPWWPGRAGSALRRAPSRLNGEADVDLAWAATTASGPPSPGPGRGGPPPPPPPPPPGPGCGGPRPPQRRPPPRPACCYRPACAAAPTCT